MDDITFWDGCTNTNEVILLYEKSVGINKWLKYYGDWYMQWSLWFHLTCKEFILNSEIWLIIRWYVTMNKKNEDIFLLVCNKDYNPSSRIIDKEKVDHWKFYGDETKFWLKNVLENYWRMLSGFLNIWLSGIL